MVQIHNLNSFEKGVLKNALLLERFRRLLKSSLYQFLVYFWDVIVQDDFVPNWHIEYLCDELQAVYERVINREPCEYDLVINVPPGSSKSTIATVMAPAWGWLKDPTLRFITGSYAADLSVDHALKSRDVLKSPKFKYLFPEVVTFRRDQDLKKSYQIEQGGSRVACAVGGAITGKHAHIINIDDPINPKQAASEVERKSARDWMDKTLSSRKANKKVTATIVIMQRLAEDDPTGHILEKEGKKVKHICLPAECTELDNVVPRELESRYVDGLLDPNRLDRDVLQAMKIDLGSMEYAGQFLQSPIAAEGNIILRKWWKFWKERPQTRPIRIVQSWDLAFTENEDNAATVCTTWEQWPHGYYIIDFWEGQEQTPQVERQIKIEAAKHCPHVVLVEKKHAGLAIVQSLQQNTTLNIVGVEVHRDKVVRARDAAPTIEAGNVYLPEDEKWTEKIIEQCAAFPGAKKADRVDSITQFLNWVRLMPTETPRASTGKKRETNRILQGY